MKVNKREMSAPATSGSVVVEPVVLVQPENDLEAIIEEKNRLIGRQYAEIERLQRELTEVIGERDALMCEVSKFKFELEMADLKRLHDDRYVNFPFSHIPHLKCRISSLTERFARRGNNYENTTRILHFIPRKR